MQIYHCLPLHLILTIFLKISHEAIQDLILNCHQTDSSSPNHLQHCLEEQKIFFIIFLTWIPSLCCHWCSVLRSWFQVWKDGRITHVNVITFPMCWFLNEPGLEAVVSEDNGKQNDWLENVICHWKLVWKIN